jgi:hypothetical protein
MNKALILISLCFCEVLFCQIGGKKSFEFLRLPSSARVSALGGSLVATVDDDVNTAANNPATLNEKTNNAIALNYNFQFAGISSGHAAYGFHIKKWNVNAHAGASFINYGEFIAADEVGIRTGTFTASESAFTLGASKNLDARIVVGANLKLVNSALEQYQANGLLLDAGAIYTTNQGRMRIAAVFQNFGSELSTLNGKRYGTPYDIQLGLSNRLMHMPFRFSVIMHRLHRWGIRYDDPDFNRRDNFFDENNEPSALRKQIDNFFRHIIFNGEFLLGKNENFKLRAGYNHLRRAELSLSEFRSYAGFSLGIGFKVKHFHIDYGVGYYHLAGGNNHLSIRTNLNYFRSKI